MKLERDLKKIFLSLFNFGTARGEAICHHDDRLQGKAVKMSTRHKRAPGTSTDIRQSCPCSRCPSWLPLGSGGVSDCTCVPVSLTGSEVEWHAGVMALTCGPLGARCLGTEMGGLGCCAPVSSWDDV